MDRSRRRADHLAEIIEYRPKDEFGDIDALAVTQPLGGIEQTLPWSRLRTSRHVISIPIIGW